MTDQKFKMESIVGPTLLTKSGGPNKKTKDVMKGKELVAFYFGANWCPPCKAFSPILIDFYNNCAEEGKLEIIYVSSDRSLPDFEEYYAKLPFLAYSTDQAELAIELTNKLGVQGIPALVVMDAVTGEFISSGREDVTAAGSDAEKGKAVIADWKAGERHPLSEAAALVQQSQAQNPIMAILMWFAKNPISIIVIMYGYKWLKKQWIASQGGEVEDADGVPDMPTAQDSEF